MLLDRTLAVGDARIRDLDTTDVGAVEDQVSRVDRAGHWSTSDRVLAYADRSVRSIQVRVVPCYGMRTKRFAGRSPFCSGHVQSVQSVSPAARRFASFPAGDCGLCWSRCLRIAAQFASAMRRPGDVSASEAEPTHRSRRNSRAMSSSVTSIRVGMGRPTRENANRVSSAGMDRGSNREPMTTSNASAITVLNHQRDSSSTFSSRLRSSSLRCRCTSCFDVRAGRHVRHGQRARTIASRSRPRRLRVGRSSGGI